MTPEGRRAKDDETGIYVDLPGLVALRHAAAGIADMPSRPGRNFPGGGRASRLRGRGLDFEEIRHYQPGDDVRSIDWNVTARTGRPHVRIFSEERDRPALIVVDQRIAMFYGTRLMMKSVAAAEFAALAAWRLLASGDRVGGIVFDDTGMEDIRPHRSEASVIRFLSRIVKRNRMLRADTDVVSDPAMLDRALARAARLAGHDSLVIVVSDFDGASDATRETLTQLARRNGVICALVHDPSALHIPERGRLIAAEGKRRLTLDFADARLRQAVSQFSGARLQRILSWQEEFGLPVLPVSAGEPMLEQAARLFARGSGKARS
ncbi:MAG: DUF58 domain-containing protein [Alphaproteobacteria bacterium HGW-Alphaproteobacteria-5]|nr:MAG: DUF58 domain-containing protein [Alphaproteobacteria bacterium HGW-Alphaproteobacteria-5]